MAFFIVLGCWSIGVKGVWQREYVNYTEAEIDITAYIVTFYNAKRLYPTLDNLPPVIFERKMAEKNTMVVSEIT